MTQTAPEYAGPGTDDGAPLLKLKGVTKNFGGLRAVSAVDLTVERGEIRGLIGPNGSGKTTLFNLMTGFLHPDEGAIFLGARDITRQSPDSIYREGIGRTFQLGKLFTGMTALQNVMVGAFVKTRDRRVAREKAETLLKFVSLYDKRDYDVQKLTVMEKKLAELARGLATQPKLVLLDEIMAGLNQVELDQMHAVVRKIHDSGSTVIMVEHIMSTVMSLCGKVSVLSSGEKIAEGTPAEIARDEQVVRSYLGQPWQGTK